MHYRQQDGKRKHELSDERDLSNVHLFPQKW